MRLQKKALKYYAQETIYEEHRVYRGEPMSEAYQIDVYPIIEGEKYHTAQEALAALPNKPLTEDELLNIIQEAYITASIYTPIEHAVLKALKEANVLYISEEK